MAQIPTNDDLGSPQQGIVDSINPGFSDVLEQQPIRQGHQGLNGVLEQQPITFRERIQRQICNFFLLWDSFTFNADDAKTFFSPNCIFLRPNRITGPDRDPNIASIGNDSVVQALKVLFQDDKSIYRTVLLSHYDVSGHRVLCKVYACSSPMARARYPQTMEQMDATSKTILIELTENNDEYTIRRIEVVWESDDFSHHDVFSPGARVAQMMCSVLAEYDPQRMNASTLDQVFNA